MEGAFKFVLALAGFFAAAIVIGVFLLVIKIFLLFFPEIHIMGLTIN